MRGRIDELTGLRAIAVSMVVVGHSHVLLADQGRQMSPLLSLLGTGSFGVTVFFVLSGFLITSLLQREIATNGKIDFWAFYKRRLLRISPAFYTFLAIVGIMTAFGLFPIDWRQIVVGSLYLWNYAHAFHLDRGWSQHPLGAWFLAHLWSLSLEEQFYWVWPLALTLLVRTGRAWVLLAIILTMPLVRIATYVVAPDLRGYIGMMFHTGADPILLGCAAALYSDAAVGRFPLLRAPIFLTLTVPTLFLILPNITGPLRGYWSITYGPTFTATWIAATIVAMVEQPNHWFCRILRWKPIVYVGLISFSLYLWQQVFMRAASPLALPFPLNILGAVAAAAASYYLVERPFLRLKERSRRPAIAPSLHAVAGNIVD